MQRPPRVSPRGAARRERAFFRVKRVGAPAEVSGGVVRGDVARRDEGALGDGNQRRVGRRHGKVQRCPPTHVAASATSGARNRILARFKPASPPDDAPPTSQEDAAASVKPGIADALDVSTIGRFVFATRVASAATNPRSSPRKTSTSSKRMSVLSS